MNRTGTISTIIIAAALAASGTAFAQQSGARDKAPVGKVERVYVKDRDGLYIEAALVRDTRGRELWADVRLAAPLKAGRKNELVQIPVDTAVRSGDVVEVAVVDKDESAFVPLPAVSRMVRHVRGDEPVVAGVPRDFFAPGAAAERALSLRAADPR